MIGGVYHSLLFVVLVASLSVTIGRADERDDLLQKYVATKDDINIERFPFQRYITQDALGRKITFYLSKIHKSEHPIPLVVCIQGSGSQSLFQEIETKKHGKLVVSGGQENVVLQSYPDQVRVLVVEKPGVKFLVQPSRPGSAKEGSKEYNREFSLSRWTEAIHAAIEASCKLPEIDSSRILVMGHSEGGQVACSVAAVNPKVTHVGFMAGGGPTQLFDLMKFAEQGVMYDPNATPEQRVQALLNDWNKMLDDPKSSTKFILGHAHLRWSSFNEVSPIDLIKKSNSKVFIAQGTEDKNSLPLSADVFYAELLSVGRDVTYEKVVGGDHGFMTKGDNGAGWTKTNRKALDWFLDVEGKEEEEDAGSGND